MLWRRRLCAAALRDDRALKRRRGVVFTQGYVDYFPEVLLASGALVPDPPDIPFMLPEFIPAEPMFEAPNACPR
jgi:hypothetical protein